MNGSLSVLHSDFASSNYVPTENNHGGFGCGVVELGVGHRFECQSQGWS